MINVLVPMAGKDQYFPENEFVFPKPLIEIRSKTIVERVIENLGTVGEDLHFIFVVSSEDCRKFHLDDTINIITNHNCSIIKLERETKGSACSALMAIDLIANNNPLLISNSDQIFETPISSLLPEVGDVDAGVVTFDSVHPRWSYVRLDDKGDVVETAEKRPISRNAIAGLYYFRRGVDFVNAAMMMIRKNESVNERFYVAPALNQMILQGKRIRVKKVPGGCYHTFYTLQKIKEYEGWLQQNQSELV